MLVAELLAVLLPAAACLPTIIVCLLWQLMHACCVPIALPAACSDFPAEDAWLEEHDNDNAAVVAGAGGDGAE
jgi:hypothetical protein